MSAITNSTAPKRLTPIQSVSRILTTGVVGAGLFGLAAAMPTAAHADDITMRIGSGHPAGPAVYVALVKDYFVPEVKKRVEAETEHTIKFAEGYGGAIAGVAETLEAVQNGILDIGAYCFCFEPAKLFLHNFPYYAPFGPQDSDQAMKAARAVYDANPWLTETFEKKYGQVLLGLSGWDNYHLGTTDPWDKAEDLKGVKFRVPGSQMLQQYYRMVGANPTPVAWGETPSAIKQGVADALDPSVGALHVFGFGDILDHVTFTRAVPDSQVFSCNLEWFESMTPEIQDAVMFAAEMTAHQNLAKVPSARAYAMAELAGSGVEFHTLSDDQLAQWTEAGGYQKSEWDSFKKELAGSMDTFAKLEEAAGTQGRYFVHDA